MRPITVPKDQLIETLKTNRGEHREIFLKAQEAFRLKVIETFEERLRMARDHEKIDIYIGLPEPEDHTSSFDTAILMLEWEIGDQITLDQQDFEKFVLNKWPWRQSFAASTQAYVG